MANKVLRNKIADYLNLGTDTEEYHFMGMGFNTIDESKSPNVDSKTYIHQTTATKTVTGYESSFAFDSDLISDEAVIMDLYDIGVEEKTGAEAERDYVRVELFRAVEGSENTFRARKYRVSVECTDVTGAGGETVTVKGNLNSTTDVIKGTFNTSTKTFTADTDAAAT